MGVITLPGQPDPLHYALPHQFDECMKKFFSYARPLGVKTISVARIADSIPMYDAFHFREDSSQRKKLTEHIGHHMRVLIAEHIASKVLESRFEEIHRRYPYSDKGKTFIPVIYQLAIGDAEAGKRASKVKAELATLDPWDPEYWATKEEATLSEMRYRFAPQEVVNLQMRQMVYMGENQWEFKEDADPKFIDQVSGEEQKARLAALRGRPSGSDPEQSSTMQREEVLERAPFPAEPMRPLPTDKMFVGDTRDLRVGFTRQDDYDLDEMIGADTSYFDELPVSDLAVRRRSHAHHLKTAFTGIVRGSIRPGDLR